MARYSIEDTTLTALGDAIRGTTGKTTRDGEVITRATIGMVGTTTEVIHIEGAQNIRVYVTGGTSNSIMYHLKFDSGSELTDSAIKVGDWAMEPVELLFENTDTVVWHLHDPNGNSSNFYYFNITFTGEIVNTMSPERMITEISKINKPNILASDIVDRTVTKITAEDLEGITEIGSYAFSWCRNLQELELPDTVTKLGEMCMSYADKLHELVLPPSVDYIHSRAFDYMSGINNLATIKILKDDDVILSDSSIGSSNLALSNIKEVLVPGKLFRAYKTHPYWDKMTSLFKHYDEWTGELSKSSSVLLFNGTEDITLSLLGFDYVPEVNITTDAPVAISNINVTTEAITFTITAQSTEGQGTITIQTTRADGDVIENTMNVKVLAEFTPSSYTVTPLEITPYTFALNDAGYYESNNQKQSNSDALCRVDISNALGQKVVFECINFAESNYDYGRLGNVNQEYAANVADNLYYANFKGKQLATVQEISYTDAVDDCFIYVSFIKDSSGDNNNDSLQFKIRFE